ncbi:hypothetical protein ECG_07709 [Echinococcus granulosus]|uniref:Transposase n=1 Tax=Echinococcus granulosus TaxID=6210 RepID=A0A068WRJ4_ECHGR|nr:hypothetical protein ECG_07709 [Echinococcus granulosus]CDS22420.1 hypothetical protein EgrG_000362300 [Echinococcus granulosus]
MWLGRRSHRRTPPPPHPHPPPTVNSRVTTAKAAGHNYAYRGAFLIRREPHLAVKMKQVSRRSAFDTYEINSILGSLLVL